MNKSSRTWWWVGWFSLLILFFVLWFNRFTIYDWATLRGYSPNAEVSQLVERSGMNDEGKKLFYIGDPQLRSGQQFNQECTSNEETKILGCYVSYGLNAVSSALGIFNYNIYIYNVDKPELSGIKEVTAAHEMLHAAYDRLPKLEKEKVDRMLTSFYESSNNEKLKQTIESYAERDSSVVVNELHSILGSEVRSLPSELEQYYSNYFEDRDKVVNNYQAYEKVFSETEDKRDQLLGELNLRNTQISKQKSLLETQSSQLADLKSQMDNYSRTGDIASFNLLVPKYNEQVNAYNQGVSQIKKLSEEYNALVETYNNIVIVQQDLVNSIDSNYQPL